MDGPKKKYCNNEEEGWQKPNYLNYVQTNTTSIALQQKSIS